MINAQGFPGGVGARQLKQLSVIMSEGAEPNNALEAFDKGAIANRPAADAAIVTRRNMTEDHSFSILLFKVLKLDSKPFEFVCYISLFFEIGEVEIISCLSVNGQDSGVRQGSTLGSHLVGSIVA